MSRIDQRTQALKQSNRAGLVTYIMACDPDFETSLATLKGLPAAGADIIELGMPFSDPMADGPTIQEAGQRALKAGGSVKRTLEMVREFRKEDDSTPIILMGYYNPVDHYGVQAFCADAKTAGVDGLIIVDLPPEEEEELTPHLDGLDFIRLIAPTSTGRLGKLLEKASGFVYYISIAGITGTASASLESVEEAVQQIKATRDLPVAVGFGIDSPEKVQQFGEKADLVVVGSAIIKAMHAAKEDKPQTALEFVRRLRQ